MPPPAEEPAPEPPAEHPVDAPVLGHTSGGLPRRSRRTPATGDQLAGAREPSVSDRSPRDAARLNGAIQQGTRRGREDAPRD
ncbi:hypothetical protein DY218_26115 [Streptomyces triticagri]|uniref:Uncharacterized protein n=1 Tax=Streptomyces triticagri TaxID=2293568 RepID=A0A372LYJ8_9ACTN|nr:hypothetical protein DY218_26115 [Streptomyces triticagri]